MTVEDANKQALARLANLLRRRYRRQAGRDFVLLVADVYRAPPVSDDLATQPIRVFHTV